jgi:hypothetical protein
MSTVAIARTQKSRESLPTLRSIFLLGKEWWHLGEYILMVHEQSRLAYKIAIGRDQNNENELHKQGAPW